MRSWFLLLSEAGIVMAPPWFGGAID